MTCFPGSRSGSDEPRWVLFFAALFVGIASCGGAQTTFGQMTSAACAGDVDKTFRHVDEARLVSALEKRAVTSEANPDPKAIAQATVSGWRADIAEKKPSSEMCASFVRVEQMGSKQRVEARSPSGVTYFYFTEIDGKLKLIDYESTKPIAAAPPASASAATSASASPSTASTAPPPKSIPSSGAKLGEPVRLRESSYTLVEVKDLGATLEGTRKPALPGEKRTTKGTFLLVRYSVTNIGQKPASQIEMPKLIDATGREIDALASESRYMQKDCVVAGLEAIPPSKSKTLCTIFEVPPDAGKLKVLLTDFGVLGEKTTVVIDVSPATPEAR